MTLDKGFVYEVKGEADNGESITVHISSVNKLTTEKAVRKCWYVIMNDFHWTVSVNNKTDLKEFLNDL